MSHEHGHRTSFSLQSQTKIVEISKTLHDTIEIGHWATPRHSAGDVLKTERSI
mgnify:CR=1